MNKIGFRIYRFKEGQSIGLTVNGGDWTKKVVDIRDILKLYNSEDETKFAMFLSFSETGAYLTIARSISGRGGDNTAGWIYIPNSIEVSGSEILEIIDVVKEELSASKGNSERLTQLFSKEYREIEAAAYMPSSSEKVYAKRNDIFYPLKDILGKMIYQPIYSNYHAVLIETQNGMEIVDNNIIDITTQPLQETLILCPPDPLNLPNGVTVHFNSPGYSQFKQPIRKNLGERVDLIFRKRRFDDIPFKIYVEENNQICGVPLFDWKKSFSRDFFKVMTAQEPKRNLTNDATISINSEELNWSRPITITESQARHAIVRISVHGYEPIEENLDLLNTDMPMIVKLHRAERVQTWKIELKDDHVAEITLRSKYLSGNKYVSPIKGYIQENGILRYTNMGVLKQRIIGFLMAVAAFIVICICVAAYNWYDKHKFTWQFGWPLVKVEKIGSHNYSTVSDEEQSTIESDTNTGSLDQNISENELALSKALAYLNNTSGKWHRDSLIKYNLGYLFDELNNYEVDSILKHGATLQESGQFVRITDAIATNKDKILSNKEKYYKGPYSNDLEITVDWYIEKLNKQIDVPHAPSSEGVVSKAAKNAQTSPKADSQQKEKPKEEKKGKKRGNEL